MRNLTQNYGIIASRYINLLRQGHKITQAFGKDVQKLIMTMRIKLKCLLTKVQSKKNCNLNDFANRLLFY